MGICGSIDFRAGRFGVVAAGVGARDRRPFFLVGSSTSPASWNARLRLTVGLGILGSLPTASSIKSRANFLRSSSFPKDFPTSVSITGRSYKKVKS